MKEIVYCPVCDRTESIDAEAELPRCRDCGGIMMRTKTTQGKWEQLDEKERDALKTVLDEKTPMFYLNEIAESVSSIAGWVRLWSILSLIGIVVIALGIFLQ